VYVAPRTALVSRRAARFALRVGVAFPRPRAALRNDGVTSKREEATFAGQGLLIRAHPRRGEVSGTLSEIPEGRCAEARLGCELESSIEARRESIFVAPRRELSRSARGNSFFLPRG